jgi:hypothetical protein
MSRRPSPTLHRPSGVILDGDPPELRNTLEDVSDEEWRELGTIDPTTGRAQIDWRRVSTWRSLAERWRWR